MRIRQYSFGSIDVDGRRYEKDLIIYPDTIQSDWWRKEGHRLQLEDIAAVLADPPEVLIVGQGEPGKMQVDQRVAETLDNLRVQLVAAPTRTACDKFNELSQKGKHVVAALHLTC
ncbi:MAG: hypothetical protein JSV16_14225 [Candidatus Hydrogenedentota bacterium]|nr:MAG: hypothetical protein JSV16_14225 [Candidatus Hydrogenedentota bacterium]